MTLVRSLLLKSSLALVAKIRQRTNPLRKKRTSYNVCDSFSCLSVSVSSTLTSMSTSSSPSLNFVENFFHRRGKKHAAGFSFKPKKNREKQNSFLKRKKSLSNFFSTEEPKLVQAGIFVFMIMGQQQQQQQHQHQQHQHHGCEQIFLDLATDSSRCLTSPR